MYFTYIIESMTSGLYYIGQTQNLEERLNRHNTNQNKFTKNKGPWKVVYAKEFRSRSEAIKFERKLKSLKSRNYLLSLIKEI